LDIIGALQTHPTRLTEQYIG